MRNQVEKKLDLKNQDTWDLKETQYAWLLKAFVAQKYIIF
jgi:hypothetical protein